jgi:DNA polymerase-3 subunit epsilon
LKGQRIAILGEPRDGALAQHLAAAGGRIVASVGSTTNMLVVATKQPYGRWAETSEPYRKANALRAAGKPIVIVSEADLRAKLKRQG